MSPLPKYENLNKAQYELEIFLLNLGKYDPARSLIERSLRNIDKVLKNKSGKMACVPEPGYVNSVLKATGRY